jgi:hypothetical protein
MFAPPLEMLCVCQTSGSISKSTSFKQKSNLFAIPFFFFQLLLNLRIYFDAEESALCSL